MDYDILARLLAGSNPSNVETPETGLGVVPSYELDDISRKIEDNKISLDIFNPAKKAIDRELRDKLASKQNELAISKAEFDDKRKADTLDRTPSRTGVQYPFSPMDPQGNDRSILDSMVSPPGIQAPLYNYMQTPQENMDQGSAMRGFENIPVMTSRMSLADLEPAPPTAPTVPMGPPKPRAQKQEAVAMEPNRSAEALIPDKPREERPQTIEQQEDPLAILKQMQQDRQDQLRNLMYAEAADRAGTAIAGGGRLKYEGGKFDSMKQLANMPVEDFMASDKLKKENTKFGLDTELSKLNLEKAKSQINDEKAKSDPNSDLSKVARASVMDSLNRIGRKDLASLVTPSMSSKQMEYLFSQNNLANMVSSFEAQQNRLEIAKLRGAEKEESAKGKAEEKDIKRLDAANKTITSSLARNNTAFGRAANIIRSAEAIEQLVGIDENLDQRQIKELAASLDSMLTTGASTVSGRAGLVPASASGDIKKIEEYITGIPKGLGQQKFVERMMETVHREKELARTQIKRESKKMLSSYADLEKKQPEAWNTMIQAHGLDPSMFSGLDAKEDKKDTKSSPELKINVDHNALDAEMKRRGL